MATTINKKINHIFLLLEKLASGQELYAQDEQLQDLLFGDNDNNLKDAKKANERSLRRYLDDIYTLYSDMIITEKKTKEFAERKVTVYRTTSKRDVSDVLKFFLEQKNDLTWVIQMLHEQDPSLLLELESSTKDTIESELKEDADIFLFKSKPFEILDEPDEQKIFASLKQAVKNHEYRNIYYKVGTPPFIDVKCLKLVYSQNNWYVAIEIETGELRLVRIQFISHVTYSKKSNYQKSILEKYEDYFLNFQNPMTLSNVTQKKAIIKALPPIAKYFKEDMKPFFRSQKFIKINDDQSVEFSIDYTQPLEILPFIKEWLPNMQLIGPDSLKKRLKQDLEASIRLLGDNT